MNCTRTDDGWVTAEHVSSCRDDCAGCKPCGENHCGLRNCAGHVNHDAGLFTCPRCIGKARRRVREIVDRYAQLPAQAEATGIDSEAFNLHGPAAAPEQIAARRTWDTKRGWCDFPRRIEDDDPNHPYAVLGRWDMAIRESYGPDTDLLVSISRAADYLTGPVLDRFAHTQEFEDFDREIRACLSHLEDVLADSRKPEQGAPCPTCVADGEGYPPRLQKRYGPDERADTWHCPRKPAHWWSDVDYRLRVDGDYLARAKVLTAAQAAERFDGLKATEIRVWGSRGLVKKLGKDANGITLYDVASIETRHKQRRGGCIDGVTCAEIPSTSSIP